MPPEPPRNLGIRFDREFSEWLTNFEDKTGIQAVVLGRNLFEAARRFYDKNRFLVFPLEITVPPPPPADPAPPRKPPGPAPTAQTPTPHAASAPPF